MSLAEPISDIPQLPTKEEVLLELEAENLSLKDLLKRTRQVLGTCKAKKCESRICMLAHEIDDVLNNKEK